ATHTTHRTKPQQQTTPSNSLQRFVPVTPIHSSKCLSDTFSSTSPRPTLRLLSSSTPPSSRLSDFRNSLASLKAWLALAPPDPSLSFSPATRPPMRTLPFKLPIPALLMLSTPRPLQTVQRTMELPVFELAFTPSTMPLSSTTLLATTSRLAP
ncbi:hypothetical protein CCMA1212_010255, partial [Trichoderma ghanense]